MVTRRTPSGMGIITSRMFSFCTGVSVGGIGVTVGGTAVAVDGIGVSVGGTGVAVGGGVSVGGTDVARGTAVGFAVGPQPASKETRTARSRAFLSIIISLLMQILVKPSTDWAAGEPRRVKQVVTSHRFGLALCGRLAQRWSGFEDESGRKCDSHSPAA